MQHYAVPSFYLDLPNGNQYEDIRIVLSSLLTLLFCCKVSTEIDWRIYTATVVSFLDIYRLKSTSLKESKNNKTNNGFKSARIMTDA
jgi:hypothetical protein